MGMRNRVLAGAAIIGIAIMTLVTAGCKDDELLSRLYGTWRVFDSVDGEYADALEAAEEEGVSVHIFAKFTEKMVTIYVIVDDQMTKKTERVTWGTKNGKIHGKDTSGNATITFLDRHTILFEGKDPRTRQKLGLKLTRSSAEELEEARGQ